MYLIIISVKEQKLYLVKGAKVVRQYSVSTSKFGNGNKEGSSKTPLGLHRVVSKIGRNAKPGEIFKARRRTRKIARGSKEDQITTRILRLEGLEKGVNKGRGIDSFERCIYIHGTTDTDAIGTPSSHGCIRMKNRDIIELFKRVPRRTLVLLIK